MMRFYLIVLVWALPYSTVSSQTIKNGGLSLQNWTGDEIELSGEWKFYPNEFILLQDPSLEEIEQFNQCRINVSKSTTENCFIQNADLSNVLNKPPILINVPEDWAQIRNTIGEDTQRGIYRLDFENPLSQTLVLASRNFAGYSVRLWILDSIREDLVYIGSSYLRQDKENHYRNKKFYFHIPPNTNSIFIEVDSIQMSARMGIVNPIYLIDENQASHFYIKKYTFIIIAVGLFVGFFVFYLVQYFIDLKLEYLYFSLVCISFALRIIALDSFHMLFTENNYLLNNFLSNASYWTGSYVICFFYLFIKRILEVKQNNNSDKLCVLISSSFVFYLHFPGEFRGTGFITILISYIFIYFLFIIKLLSKNFNSKKYHIKYVSRIMTLYLVIFVSTAINDFLLAYGKITGVYLTQYGFFFLLFGQIILIAARNRNIRTQNEKLNFNLKREFKEKKELLVTKEDLEASIQKIKSELQKAEKQLIQADKMSTLGTLMAGLSHEINNPMQFIDSNRYLIEEELKSVKDLSKNDAPKNGKSLNYSLDSIQNRMEKIQIGVRKITELNRSMMNLSRLDDQVQSKEKIIDILKETLLILDFKLKNHEVMIDVNENIFIRCHRGQVGQVFMNLLSNAADAISEKTNKKGKIQIIGYVEANQFTICIEDSGVGFSEKIKEKVFEGFFTTKGIERGTGLGLSITRKIMDIHKGKIQLDKSIALGGAKVLVIFPIEE